MNKLKGFWGYFSKMNLANWTKTMYTQSYKQNKFLYPYAVGSGWGKILGISHLEFSKMGRLIMWSSALSNKKSGMATVSCT